MKQKADEFEICGDDEYCKFDIAATGRVEIGEATIQTEQEFEELILSKPGTVTINFSFYCCSRSKLQSILY